MSAALLILAAAACGCFRVAKPARSETAVVADGSAWINTWLWGIVVDDSSVACANGGVMEMDTTVVVPVSILTLGILTPVRASWKCELPQRRASEVGDEAAHVYR